MTSLYNRRLTVTILESKVQSDVCAYARNCGWYVRKFKAPGRRNVPDCLFIKGSFAVAADIVLDKGGVRSLFFVEFKQLGKLPRKGQLHEFKKIERQGIPVYVIDEWLQGKRLVDRKTAELSAASRKAAHKK